MHGINNDSGLLLQVAAAGLIITGVGEMTGILLHDISRTIAEEAMAVAFDIAERYPELADEFMNARTGPGLTRHVDTIVSNLTVDDAEEAARNLGDSMVAALT